jgi:hypothetical protein
MRYAELLTVKMTAGPAATKERRSQRYFLRSAAAAGGATVLKLLLPGIYIFMEKAAVQFAG